MREYLKIILYLIILIDIIIISFCAGSITQRYWDDWVLRPIVLDDDEDRVQVLPSAPGPLI